MSKRLNNVTQMVWWLLENYPETRSSDRRLIELLYDEFYGVWDMPFYEVIRNRQLPSFETIRRCRQKVQEEREDLRAVKEVEDVRIAKQEEYIEYAREDVRI